MDNLKYINTQKIKLSKQIDIQNDISSERYSTNDMDYSERLELAYKINCQLINENLKYLLIAVAKELHEANTIRIVPRCRKKIINKMNEIIQDDSITIYYDYDTYFSVGLKICCSYNSDKINIAASYIRNHTLPNDKVKTKRELLNIVNKVYIMNKKIDVLDKKINMYKNVISEITKGAII